jgi:hypothetical protein
VGVPFSILDAQSLASYDLRRFNVLILPPSYGLEGVLEPALDSVRTWVEGGGTLIACASSAGALTRGQLGLSQVVLRRDALDELELYTEAAARERDARRIEIDEEVVWNGPKVAPTEPEDGDSKAEDEKEKKEITPAEDERARLFSPHGATLRAAVNSDAWITTGLDEILPVPVDGANVFLSHEPVTTAVRLDPPENLRTSGLLWPEARERHANSAWLTVESLGHGQLVLFAATPAFRGYHLATARLLANAVVLGPGLGTDQPLGW